MSITDRLLNIIEAEEAEKKRINLSLAERMHMDMVHAASLNPRYNVEIDTANPNTLSGAMPSSNRVDHDPVHRPQHYKAGDVYETIRVIEAWGLNYHLGNTVKYISRAGKKGDLVEDLEKARWYLDREIKRLKEERTVRGAIG